MTIRSLLLAFPKSSLRALAAIALASLLSSCAHFNPPEPEPEPEPPVVEKKPPPKPIKPPPPSPLYEWYGSDEYVSLIEIDVNAQKAIFYSGDKQVGWTTVASGIHKYPTPIGTFAVTEKVQDKKSNLYGKIYSKSGKLVKRNAKMGVHSIPAGGRFKGAPMPYFLRLTNDGIGMHAGPIPRPGNRASHGCIRMPKKFAPILYRYVDIGTPVTIKGKGPSYASYVTKQRKRSKPKPKPAVVAKANPPVAPATDTTPVPATPNNPTTGQPATASGMTAGAPQPVEIAAPASATEAASVTPAQSTAGIPANTSAYGAARPTSPASGLPPPTVGMPHVPAYPPAYSVPAVAVPYSTAPAAALPVEPAAPAPVPDPVGIPSPSGSAPDPTSAPAEASVAAPATRSTVPGTARIPSSPTTDTIQAAALEAPSPVPEEAQAPISGSAAGKTNSPAPPAPATEQQPVPVETPLPPAAAAAPAESQG